jgi:5-methylcytosine-specific restriction endonuclease McrA
MSSSDMATWANLSRAELLDIYFDNVQQISLGVLKAHKYLRRKPLHGGPFGSGRFSVASSAYVLGGLDYVTYFVIDDQSGFVLSGDENRNTAVKAARGVLTEISTSVRIQVECGKFAKLADAWREEEKKLRQEQFDAHRAALAAERSQQGNVKSISRRRRRIFDESGGKCHYCSTALTLDGKWHIEHKMPKALGGGDEPGNLVASCVPCNHEKIDTTDIEYKAKRAARGQA